MNHIYKEAEFYIFMNLNGPNTKKSKSNYISWLRFVVENFNNINESLSKNDIKNICISLKEDSSKRNKYKKDEDISNIKSALNKYHKFIKTTSHYSRTTDDILNILSNELVLSKKQEIEARIGQGKYRKSLLDFWGMCSVTKYSKIDFLIASHIKPWKDSSDFEKMDPYNGLLLKPNLDKLFDYGYITFDDDGNIIISNLLTKDDRQNMGVSIDMKLFIIHKEHKPYLEYHRNKIFI